MRLKLYTFVTLCLMLTYGQVSFGQVTIGSNETPIPGALLDLKQWSATTTDATTANKGFLLPRVSLKAANQLTPLYGGVDNGNGTWTDTSTLQEKLASTGMIVYNTNEYAINIYKAGICIWDGGKWALIGNNIADYSLVCNSIVVNGTYKKDVDLTALNTITLKVTVTTGGDYKITTDAINGISFKAEGKLPKGTHTVTLQGTGRPTVDKSFAMIITAKTLNGSVNCTATIPATPDLANYAMYCEYINVNGIYKKGEAMALTNSIDVKVVVSIPGKYKITTDEVNGISFNAEGVFTKDTQWVTLKASGTLTIDRPFDIIINAQTMAGNVTCVATIPVTYPDMTYAVIGAASYYSWGGNPRLALLNASTQPGGSFSPTGIVRVGQLSQWGKTMTNTSSAKTALGSAYFKANGTLDPSITYPDVILYYSYGANADDDLAKLLAAYVNAGGGILFGSADFYYDPVNTMMQHIFGLSAVAKQQVAGVDDVYPIANMPNDPIINGPFGNLSGKHWGEDNDSAGSIILTELPAGAVQICTAQSRLKASKVPSTSSIVWYHNGKNFVYIGDSTGASTSSVSTNDFPTMYNQNGTVYLPQFKLYGYAGYRENVYNAALELNALAWLLNKAAINGINPH